MRIAYFISQYPMVSHSFIRREVIELENQGIQIERFSIRRNETDLVDTQDINELPKTHYLTERGIRKVFISVILLMLQSPIAFIRTFLMAISMGRRSHVGVIKHFFYLIEACVLGSWVKEYGIQHIHAHFGSNPTAIALLAKQLYAISYSFTVHGPYDFDKPEALSLGLKIEHASFVVAISSFGRSQLYRWCSHAHWKKIHIVHCALGVDFLEAGITPVPNNHRLICVGRLCEQKGQLLLVEAIHRIDKLGIPVQLTLAGDGPMRNEIEALIKQYNLFSHIRITGWISGKQIREEILGCRSFVLPSFAEGLPVALMEACALHRPSVMTYIAGIPELIETDDSGWLVPSGSVELLSDALIEVLNTPTDDLDMMARKAYQRLCLNHDIRSECKKIKTLFKNTLNQ